MKGWPFAGVILPHFRVARIFKDLFRIEWPTGFLGTCGTGIDKLLSINVGNNLVRTKYDLT